MYYAWGATSEYQFKIGDCAPMGAGYSKISGRRSRPHQPFFFFRKLGEMIFRFHMVYKSGQIFLPFCHNSRVWQADGRTDGRTPFSSLVCAGIPCRAEKTDEKRRKNDRLRTVFDERNLEMLDLYMGERRTNNI